MYENSILCSWVFKQVNIICLTYRLTCKSSSSFFSTPLLCVYCKLTLFNILYSIHWKHFLLAFISRFSLELLWVLKDESDEKWWKMKGGKKSTEMYPLNSGQSYPFCTSVVHFHEPLPWWEQLYCMIIT